MKLFSQVKQENKQFMEELKTNVQHFVGGIDKNGISMIMLTGSVARGDFKPHPKLGGKVELLVYGTFEKEKLNCLFGPNEDKDISYHCCSKDGVEYKIDYKLSPHLNLYDFKNEHCEPFLRSFDEGEVLYIDDRYKEVYSSIKAFLHFEKKRLQDENDVWKILSIQDEYQIDKWKNRDFNEQTSFNRQIWFDNFLNHLYHLNGQFIPPQNRKLYYAMELEIKPEDFVEDVQRWFGKDLERGAETLSMVQWSIIDYWVDWVKNNV